MSVVRLLSIDFETSKKEAGEIIELGKTDIWLDTETRRCEVGAPVSQLFGITGPMDPGAQGTHHITQEEIEGLAPCTEDDLRAAVGDVDFLVGHNCSYEQDFLTPEITGSARWVCTYKAALRAWEEAPEHNLQALRYWRGLKLDPTLALPAHRGGPDSYVGAHILAELAGTELIRDLVRWTLEPRHYPTCPLHKHKGQRWSDVPHSYLTWMLSATEMEFDLKFAARAELNRRAEQGA